eukprot:5160590-Karenia_brevis.AAC.1
MIQIHLEIVQKHVVECHDKQALLQSVSALLNHLNESSNATTQKITEKKSRSRATSRPRLLSDALT